MGWGTWCAWLLRAVSDDGASATPAAAPADVHPTEDRDELPGPEQPVRLGDHHVDLLRIGLGDVHGNERAEGEVAEVLELLHEVEPLQAADHLAQGDAVLLEMENRAVGQGCTCEGIGLGRLALKPLEAVVAEVKVNSGEPFQATRGPCYPAIAAAMLATAMAPAIMEAIIQILALLSSLAFLLFLD